MMILRGAVFAEKQMSFQFALKDEEMKQSSHELRGKKSWQEKRVEQINWYQPENY
ncbi:hypothetical protein [Nitrosomonas sp. Nm33]|uniref:hypothetical protein n=1 Tax=Nitrosomonas sp. Nm33 TaxID=133724 RepID=UPI001C40B669